VLIIFLKIYSLMLVPQKLQICLGKMYIKMSQVL